MSLIHWWPLNGDTQDRINNIQLTNNGATIVDNGKIGKCYTFNGSTNLTIPYSSLNTLGSSPAQFSFAFWVKLNSAWTGWGQVFTIGRNGGSWTDIRIGFDIANDKTGYFTISDGSAATSYNGPKHALTIGKWYHIAATFDNKEMKLFVDGQPASTPQATASVLPSFSSDTIIAIGGNSSEKGECDINDVRIYDHVLSQAEIKELSKAMIMHYTFNTLCSENLCDWRNTSTISSTGWGGAKSYANEELTLTSVSGWQAHMWDIGADNVGKTATFSFEYLPEIVYDSAYAYIQHRSAVGYGGESKRLDLTKTEWTKMSFTFPSVEQYVGLNLRGVDSSGNTLSIKFRYVKIALSDCDDTYTEYGTYMFPYNETGLVQPTNHKNLIPTNNRALGARALQCNQSWLYTEANTNGQEHLTLAAWVNPTDYSGDGVIIGGTYLCVDSSGRLTVYCYGKTPESYFTGTKVLPKGQWSHIAVTWDSNYCTGYVNGVQEFQKSHVGTPNSTHHNKKDLGSEYGTRRFFNGLIDDARVYNTCLSAKDIQLLSSSRGMISNRGDIMCAMISENENHAGIGRKGTLDTMECYEEINEAYERLEFLESTGSQYVDTGYVTTSSDYSYEVDIIPTAKGSFYSYMGFMASGTTPRAGLHEYSGTFMLGANATTNSTVSPVVGQRVLLKAQFKSGAQRLYKDGEQIASNTTGFNHSTNTLSTHIFGRNYASGRNLSKIKLYEAKIYEQDVVVRDYVPARRKSDGVLGLYEIFTGNFIANIGSGTFKTGPTLTNGQALISSTKKIGARNIIEV